MLFPVLSLFCVTDRRCSHFMGEGKDPFPRVRFSERVGPHLVCRGEERPKMELERDGGGVGVHDR